ncbi:hypothetical protein L9F63_001590, partial [Diploptera punctata]
TTSPSVALGLSHQPLARPHSREPPTTRHKVPVESAPAAKKEGTDRVEPAVPASAT